MKKKLSSVFGRVFAALRKAISPDHRGRHYLKGRPGPAFIAKYGNDLSVR